MDTINSDKDKKFNKAKELRNSVSLRKYKSSNYPEVTSLVDYLFDEMVSVFGLSLIRPSSIKNLKHHIAFFVLNLYKAYCIDPTKVIPYSRDRSAYSGKKSRYKNKFGLSFRYSVEDTETGGKPVVTFLISQGYIENFNFQYDKKNPNNSYQSRMRATPKLIELIIDQYEVSEDMAEHYTSDEELVVMKGVKPKPKWITVNENGKNKRKKLKPKRRVCKTPDKPAVREMRKNLEIINAVMQKAEITLDISDAELKKLNARMLDDPDSHKQAIDFSRKRIKRVFLDRRLDRGGRFYGPWYQNILKGYRQFIMIDGAPTLELDYSSLHPNLLYHFAGADPPTDDLYELDGYKKDKATRKFLKGVFLRMINSDSRIAAKGSVRKDVFKKGKLTAPKELGKLKDEVFDPVIDKFLKKHASLSEKFIFKEKDLGNMLQNIDSKIAEDVLLHFAKKDIAVLPMHDSFIIAASLFKELKDFMDKAVYNTTKHAIPISNDNLSPLISRTLGRFRKSIENATSEEEWINVQAEIFNEFSLFSIF